MAALRSVSFVSAWSYPRHCTSGATCSPRWTGWLPVSADQIAALDARTEGWITGLHFAALAMRDQRDLAGFVGG
jgi:hypothetical protein